MRRQTFDALYRRHGPTMRLLDVAPLLQMAPQSLRNKINRGWREIKFKKIGYRWVARTADVAAFIDRE